LRVTNYCRRDSFDNIKKWLAEANEFCNAEVSIILVGNKSDLENK